MINNTWDIYFVLFYGIRFASLCSAAMVSPSDLCTERVQSDWCTLTGTDWLYSLSDSWELGTPATYILSQKGVRGHFFSKAGGRD